MDDPRTFWLTVTNIVLGAVVLLCVLGVATGVVCNAVARWKKRRKAESELDRDMHDLFH